MIFIFCIIMNQRIHINEAVRTYNKTRQTFYNWIKKWYLSSKKINNKVYVATTDVEKLLSDYRIEWDTQHAPVDNDSYTPTHTSDTWRSASDEEVLYELVSELNKQKYLVGQQIETQKSDMLQEINLTKRELWTDIQRAAEGVQQQVTLATEAQKKQLDTKTSVLHTHLASLTLHQKKQRFRISYILLIIFNITLLTFLA